MGRPSFLVRYFLSGFVVSVLCGIEAIAESSPATRADVAHLLTLGRPATAPERNRIDEASPQSHSLREVIATVRAQLAQDREERNKVRERAWFDAFGSMPPPPSVLSEPDESPDYRTILTGHLATLGNSPTEYAQVVNRAYREVIRRDAYAEELDYWKKHSDTLPYLLLIGCIEDWARRNQPGLMVTSGKPTISINCELLGTHRLSPQLAAEVRAQETGWPESARVLVPGGQQITAEGGIAFIAIGVR